MAIADVSTYVRHDTDLDLEARERATSIYYPTHVIPMLPESLSNGLCSLNPNVERYTLCVEMLVSAQGELESFEFYQACILSKRRFTYTQVQEIIAAGYKSKDPSLTPNLLSLIENSHKLYLILVEQKRKRGAVSFDSAEPKFSFNEDGTIKDIFYLTRNDAHKLIEEFMILANCAAGTFCEQHNLIAPHRNHDIPPAERIERLNQFLANYGLSISEFPTSFDYQELASEIEGREDSNNIYTHILRSFPRAVYEPISNGHFGLALKHYAQFTSPIRRYPDLLLHRVIKNFLFKGDPSEGAYNYDYASMESLCSHCSDKEFIVEKAYYDLLDWIKCVFIKRYIGEAFVGVISHVTRNGAFVTIPQYQIDGFVSVSSNNYHVGQKLNIVVDSVNENKREISFLTYSQYKTMLRRKGMKNSLTHFDELERELESQSKQYTKNKAKKGFRDKAKDNQKVKPKGSNTKFSKSKTKASKTNSNKSYSKKKSRKAEQPKSSKEKSRSSKRKSKT